MPINRKSLSTLSIIGVIAISGCSTGAGKTDRDLGRMQGDIGDMRQLLAEQTAAITTIREELRNLYGRIEETDHRVAQTQNLQQDVSSLQYRIPPPKDVPIEALEEDEAYVATLPLSIGQPFKDALKDLRKGQYGDALNGFQRLLQTSIGREWEPKLVFWIGICKDGMADPRAALNAYYDFNTSFPKDPRAPLVLLKQSDALLRLGDKEAARLTLKKITTAYGSSKEAAQANEKLKRL